MEVNMLGFKLHQPTRTYSRIWVADSNYQLILSHIAQQHHSCPNDIVISIGSFNCRCLALLNGPIVDCIVVSSMSRTIQ